VRSRHAVLEDPYEGTVRFPPAYGWVLAVVIPIALFVGLEFAGWVLWIVGTVHSGPSGRAGVTGGISRVCVVAAWLVLLGGLVRFVLKLRTAWARRRQTRHQAAR
jgi:hypothetical protein